MGMSEKREELLFDLKGVGVVVSPFGELESLVPPFLDMGHWWDGWRPGWSGAAEIGDGPGRERARDQPEQGAVGVVEHCHRAGIAENLVVSEAAVNRHVGNVFAKLGVAPGDDRNRRTLATLTYLRDGAQLNRP